MKYFEPFFYKLTLPVRSGLEFDFKAVYLGKNLTAEFDSLYIEHFRLVNHYQVQESQPPFYQRFDISFRPSFRRAINYFLRTQIKNKDASQAHNAGDRLFEAFTPIWRILLDNQRLFSASLYWRRLLEVVGRWERRNNCEVHKGTPYSFWSLSEILAGNYDAGFMLMHKALAEDLRYKNTTNVRLETPAGEFVRMSIRNRGSFFRGIVLKMRQALSARIRTYNSDFNRNFSLKEVERKFSLSPDLKEAALFFYFSHLRAIRSRQLLKLGLGDSNLASHIFLESLLGFCKVVEVLVRETNAARRLSKSSRRFYLKDFLIESAPLFGWSKCDVSKIVKDVKRNVEDSTQRVAEQQFLDLLDRKVTASDGRRLPAEVVDYLLLCNVRNYAAHSAGVVPSIFVSRWRDVSQAIYNGLFFAIENYQSI